MRRLVLVLLALLLAASAGAAPRYVGAWVYGSPSLDNVRVLKLKVRDNSNVGWGVTMGSCYTPYLEVRKKGATTIFATLTGSWADSTESDAMFPIGSIAVLAPTSGYQDYECYLKLVKGGSVGYLGSDDDAGLFLFRAQRWP